MDFSSLIGALGAVGGGILTANSIDSQNAMANSQFNANLAFQRYQYEDMKRWQSPANQLRLLREAGLNPALALDSRLSGNALTSVGGVSPTAQHAVGDFNSLPQVAGSLISALSENQLIEGQNAKNFADAAKGLQDSIGSSIENAYKHGDKRLAQFLLKKEGELAETDLAFQMSTFGRRVEQEQFKSALLMSQVEALSISNRYAPEKYKNEFALLMAQTGAAVASGKLSYEQASEVLQRKIASFGTDKQDALDLFDASMDFLDMQIIQSGASAMNSADADLKSNPMTASVRGFNVGQIHNDIKNARRRLEFRKNMRLRRHVRK